jgi:methylmalonyl-CoA mutase C-terminal domain/subunit
VQLLKDNGQTNVKVFLGGIIPDEDVAKLQQIGVAGIYGPGSSTQKIIEDIRNATRQAA